MIKKLLESLNTIESAVDETVLGSTKPYFYKKYASADQKVPDQQILGHEPKSDTHGDQFWGGCAEEEGVEQTQAPIEEDLIAHLANEFADFLRDRAPILDDILPNAEDHELGKQAEDRELSAVTEDNTQEAQDLAFKIRLFLEKYGKHSADNPTEWNSPDASELETAATELENFDNISDLPRSSWESGGYTPYNDKKGRELHDQLLDHCGKFIKNTNNLAESVKTSLQDTINAHKQAARYHRKQEQDLEWMGLESEAEKHGEAADAHEDAKVAYTHNHSNKSDLSANAIRLSKQLTNGSNDENPDKFPAPQRGKS